MLGLLTGKEGTCRSALTPPGSAGRFGAEHEFGDWDTCVALPPGFARSPDHTIVNGNGVAAQPDPRHYRYGGEINTPPTVEPEGQVGALGEVLATHPDALVNYRSNLHIHVRVPGLRHSLPHLKRLQEYIHRQLPLVIDLIEPIPRGRTLAERKREKRRKVSHHTLLTPERLAGQLAAPDVASFFEREVPRSRTGQVLWHAQPRLAVGLRQLLQTDTIEFRHFPGTLGAGPLLTCVEWCRDFLLAAFRSEPVAVVWRHYQYHLFPAFPPFEYETEVGYQATAARNGLDRAEIDRNIDLILGGRFHGSREYQEAAQRACGMQGKRVPKPAGGGGPG